MYKRIIISILAVAIAVPVLAQGGRRLQERRPLLQKKLEKGAGLGLRLNALEKALNLTPDQVSSLKALLESNRAQIQAIGTEAREKGQALRALMAQPNPNPVDVGNAMLALKAVRAKGQQERESLLNSFKAALTPDQLKTLEGLQTARKNLGARRGFGLRRR